MLTSLDNNLTLFNTLRNPFPNGLSQPPGAAGGLLTGVGPQVRVVDHAHGSTRVTARDPLPEFALMKTLIEEHKWPDLIELCERQMKQVPEWLTPYAFAAVGYANLGEKQKAVSLLEYVRDQSGGNPEYVGATRLLDELWRK